MKLEHSAHKPKYDLLAAKRAEAAEPAGAGSNERQHKRGKRTARERVEALVDPGSFVELDQFAVHRSTAFGLDEREFLGDGVVTGRATIDGRQIFLFSQDFTVLGGSLGEVFAEKICKVMDLAVRTGSPMIGINDSGGARIQEGVVSLGGYAEIFWRNVQASGVIPQFSLIAGPCAGGAVYSPAITDFTIMVEKISQMFITGPEIIKTVTGEDVTFEELGGALAHATKSGVTDLVAADEDDMCLATRRLLSFIPQNNLEDPPRYACDDDPERLCPDLDALIPDSPNKPYDIKDAIESILDDGDFFELGELYAPNIVIGFGRIDGATVGIVGEPAESDGRRARHRLVDQGRALRALLRRLQHPARHVRRRPRLLAGDGARVRRHHQARREAALRVRRSDGPEDHDHHAQSLRRRLRRHGLQAHPSRLQHRLADRGDRRDGRRRRRPDDLPPRDRRGARSRRRARPSSCANTNSASRTRSSRRSAVTSTTSSRRAARGKPFRARLRPCEQARRPPQAQARQHPALSSRRRGPLACAQSR